VRDFVEEQEKNSDSITAPEIADYREQFEKLKASRARLVKFRASAAAQDKAKAMKEREKTGEAPPEQLNKTWLEFVELILAPKRRRRIAGAAGEVGYLDTPERCQTLFAQFGRLAKMPANDRQFVGGTTREGGWFGSMRGAGYFKQRLNDDPASLDAALDYIPLRGGLKKATLMRSLPLTGGSGQGWGPRRDCWQ
jgi:hypothetical protein